MPDSRKLQVLFRVQNSTYFNNERILTKMKTIAKKITSHALVWGIVAAVVVVAAATTLGVVASKRSKEAEVLTVSTLKEIVNVSELSTFTAVYNGIAKAMDEEEPDEIDYYVSYEARVNAGINFEKVEIQLDEDT